jgi:hypothetical protein
MKEIIDSFLNWTLAVDWVASVKDWKVSQGALLNQVLPEEW